MPQVIIKDNRCFLKDDISDQNFLYTLDNLLSFRVQGAEFMYLFKTRKWDGYKRLLSKDLSFPYGLLERVKKYYKDNNINLDIVDERPEKTPNQEMDISQRLKKINKEPYDYQLDILNTAMGYDRGIIKAPTGSGKSLMIALIAAKFGKQTAIYVIGKDLLYQFYSFFCDIFGKNKIGIIGDGQCDIKQINIISIWSAGQVYNIDKKELLLDDEKDDEEKTDVSKYDLIRDCLEKSKVHLVDECHMSAAQTFQTLFQNLIPEILFGFSATPTRSDNADLLVEGMLGGLIVNLSASYLIDRGFLVRPIIRFKTVPKYPETLPKNYHTIYSKYVIENEDRNNLVLEAAENLISKGYQTLVLFNNIKHGKILYELFKDKVNCKILDGSNNMEERDDVKDELTSGKLDCILASKIFEIGIDLPRLSGLVIASGGKSSVKSLQRIGRIIRKYPGKKYAAVIDFNDQAHFLNKHSKLRYKTYASEAGFDVQFPKIK